MNIASAYQICEDTIKHHSKTFYYAFSFLPETKRQAVWAVYGFCRKADDIVDEGSRPLEELLIFEAEMYRFFQGDFSKEDPVWVALADVFQRFPMDKQPFIDMLNGQKMDLESKPFHTLGDVLDYSYHVASAVGLMLLPILAPNQDRQLYDGAVSLGYAMQLTNILRDIGEDLERGRVYLPAKLLQKYHYSVEDLKRGVINPAFIGVWEEMARESEKYYERAKATFHLYPREARVPVKAAAYFYQAILKEVRKQGYDVFAKKNYVSAEIKEEILSKIS
ncbi:phytoene synthase [Bacillus ectoiniformans]|nr:phytoene/squalene synthase family protein [Bacillus ectoiniformans]MBM7647568.1 phytoene synthase [Bacillus ectoiniformans]